MERTLPGLREWQARHACSRSATVKTAVRPDWSAIVS
jgi:hypothetical protein